MNTLAKSKSLLGFQMISRVSIDVLSIFVIVSFVYILPVWAVGRSFVTD